MQLAHANDVPGHRAVISHLESGARADLIPLTWQHLGLGPAIFTPAAKHSM